MFEPRELSMLIALSLNKVSDVAKNLTHNVNYEWPTKSKLSTEAVGG